MPYQKEEYDIILAEIEYIARRTNRLYQLALVAHIQTRSKSTEQELKISDAIAKANKSLVDILKNALSDVPETDKNPAVAFADFYTERVDEFKASLACTRNYYDDLKRRSNRIYRRLKEVYYLKKIIL